MLVGACPTARGRPQRSGRLYLSSLLENCEKATIAERRILQAFARGPGKCCDRFDWMAAATCAPTHGLSSKVYPPAAINRVRLTSR